MHIRTMALAFFGLIAFSTVQAQECSWDVRFPEGKTSTRIEGTITGCDYCDYKVEAKKNQALIVQNSSEKSATILQGPMEAILANGEPVILPEDGLYILRVLMPRPLAKKGEQDSYVLTIDLLPPVPQEMPVSAQEPPPVAPKGHDARTSVNWAGYYHGVVPCASCPGIDTWLRLEQQGSAVQYTLLERYLEQRNGVFQSRGKAVWSADGSTLRLKGQADDRALFVDEGFVAFLGPGQTIPEANDTYHLHKLHTFSGNRAVFFVAPDKMTTRQGPNGAAIVRIKDGIINFGHSTKAGHKSLRADFEIFCGAKQYSMPTVTYYQEPFAGGVRMGRTTQKGNDRQPFSGRRDVLSQAADAFCPAPQK
ncbi:MAG: copper resistance protein NlpE [Desulfobulbus sp.]